MGVFLFLIPFPWTTTNDSAAPFTRGQLAIVINRKHLDEGSYASVVDLRPNNATERQFLRVHVIS